MMKMPNILNYITENKKMFMIVLALVAVGLGLYFYMNGGKPDVENFLSFLRMPERLENVVAPVEPVAPLAPPQPEPAQEDQGMIKVDDKMQGEQIAKVVAGGDQLKPEDLLPKYDEENKFAKENPVSKLLKEQNFLISGYHVGLNTVMQSNKIPYHDIRSMPPIPKENIGPWNQSSFEQSPAQMRRFFEIGA